MKREMDKHTAVCPNTRVCVCVCVCVRASAHSLNRVQLFVTPLTVAYQAPMAMGFSRREYGSGLPFPSPGGLPDSGTKPVSPALAGTFFTTGKPGKPINTGILFCNKKSGSFMHTAM